MGLEELKNLTEVTSKRQYNKKVYNVGKGKQRYICHTAHIHYKDGSDYKDINTKLSFKDGTWKHQGASYHPTIPEYSDSWFEFYNAYENTNHTIKAKPICNHVQGKYTESDEGNFVLYPDAFGKGVDLKVYSYWAGLKKVIIVNEKPEDLKTALTFDFELELPSKEEVVNNKTSKISAKVIDTKTSAEWVKSEALDFKGKDLKIGLDNKYSYFRDALMWDSAGLVEKVEIKLYQKDGVTYLRKTIPAEFLQKATFPIYTDHPTSYYAGAGDGYVSSLGKSTWTLARDATTGTDVSYTATNYTLSIYSTYFLSNYGVVRSFFPIDTSGIDDLATIVTAVLKVYANGDNNYSTNSSAAYIVPTSQDSTSSLATSDFDNISFTNYGSGNYGNYGSAYNDYTLNSTGISNISKTGITKIGLICSNDFNNSTPTGRNQANFYYSEDTGSTDPYLDITVQTLPSDKTYTRQSVASLPADDTDLTTAFDSQDYTDVATEDSTYVSQSST